MMDLLNNEGGVEVKAQAELKAVSNNIAFVGSALTAFCIGDSPCEGYINCDVRGEARLSQDSLRLCRELQGGIIQASPAVVEGTPKKPA